MQNLQLSIPEPCHENWYNMKPTEQGRFCNACTKEVVDFSMMTDTEVLNYFSVLTNEKVCGRALPSQLDRTITRPKEPKKRLFWYWNYIMLFFMFFSKANTVKAQGGVKRVTEISNAPACKVGEAVKSGSRIISGKVTDIDGNPVSFATIKTKGSPSGLFADPNGGYSIKVNPNDVLSISGAGFKDVEIPVGTQNFINAVLEKGSHSGLLEVIVVGGMSLEDIGFNTWTNPKYTASLLVKDDKSGLPINKAKISIAKKYSNDNDTVFTDKKGKYKLKAIKAYDNYYIKIEADGYEANEFTITSNDFNDRKKTWEVLLRKQKIESTQSSAVKLGNETRIRLGQVSVTKEGKGALYVVDGSIMSNAADINPDDVEDYFILQAPAAVAIYGPNGENGAIVITTRMAKVKRLDTVTVSSNNNYLRGRTGGLTMRTSITRYSEVKTRINTILTDSLKIYPNPVQRGDQFNISLKLKQTGIHKIQIADATGRIVLQKQINVVAKEHIEKIPTDNRWGSGVYYIRVFDNNNKPISTNSFIVR